MLLRVNSSAAQASSQNDQLEASANLAKTYCNLITSTGFLTEASAGLAPGVQLTPGRAGGPRQRAGRHRHEPHLAARHGRVARGGTQRHAGDGRLRGAHHRERRRGQQRGAAAAARGADRHRSTPRSRTPSRAAARRSPTRTRPPSTASTTSSTRCASSVVSSRPSAPSCSAPARRTSWSRSAPRRRPPRARRPSRRDPVFNAALGLFFGLVVGLILAWLRDQLDRRVQSVAELERLSGVPTLAVVPIVRGQKAASVLENAFDARARRRDPRLAVTRGPRADGHRHPRRRGHQPDGRRARPRLRPRRPAHRRGRRRSGDGRTHRRAGRRPRPGRRACRRCCRARHRSRTPSSRSTRTCGCSAPARGLPLPTAQLDGRSLDGLLDDLRARFDVIVVDTPPTTRSPVASVLAVRTGGLVLVARLGTVQRSDVTSAVRAFQAASIPTIGLVVHSADAVASTYARGRRRRVLAAPPRHADASSRRGSGRGGAAAWRRLTNRSRRCSAMPCSSS